LLNQCPHHNLPQWYVLHIFYGGLGEANRTEVDLALGGAFMEYPVTKAWELLERIRRNRETWSFNIGGEGGIEIDYDCINAFNQTGKVDDLAKDLHLDTNIVLHVIKSFTEHIEAPKKDWIHYVPPPEPMKKVHTVVKTPLEPRKERPPYVEPIPFPRTMQKHILVQQCAD
jgi:hypothetical protein